MVGRTREKGKKGTPETPGNLVPNIQQKCEENFNKPNPTSANCRGPRGKDFGGGGGGVFAWRWKSIQCGRVLKQSGEGERHSTGR